VAFLVFGLAGSLWVLFAARIGGGILTAASLPTLYAYIADVTPPEKRAGGMAMIGVAFGIGFAFGPWIGAVLGSEDIRVPAFFVAGMACLNFLFALVALPESHHPDDVVDSPRKRGLLDIGAFASMFRRPVLGQLLTLFSVQNFAMAMLEATFTWLVLVRFLGVGVAGERLTPEQESSAAEMVGPVFGIVGVSVMVVQGAMMAGLARRIGERRLVKAGALMLAAAMFWVGSATSMIWLKVASVFVAAGTGILHPSLSSLTSQAAGESEKGSVMGVQQGVGSLARMVAPPLGTWLLQRFGSATPFYVSGALMLVGFLLSLGLPAFSAEKTDSEDGLMH
jgi:MFS family permease